MPVNTIVWRKLGKNETDMPYLHFAPHCESCGVAVEKYEGVPLENIFPYQTFLCRDCQEMDDGHKRFAHQQLEAGAWTELQAEAFLKSCKPDF